jgi:hypothetical protein
MRAWDAAKFCNHINPLFFVPLFSYCPRAARDDELARLLAKQGRRDEARAIRVQIYNWFTEGFDHGVTGEQRSQLCPLTYQEC